MKTNRSNLKIYVVLFLIFGLTSAWSCLTQAQAKTYNIKFQMAWHTQHPEYKAYQKFIEMVETETDGKVTFTLFPASQLVSRGQSLSALKMGTINMLASCGAYYHGMVPEGDVDWLPYVSSTDRARFWNLMNGDTEFSRIVHEAFEKRVNARLLTSVICGREVIIGRENNIYDSLEDLKGIKMRAAGGVATRIVKALGASPVTIATGEIYPAVQRGTVQALIFPDYGLKDYKLFEVAKTISVPPVYNWNDDLWINQDFFDSLPPDIQKALTRVALKWGRWASTEYWPKYMKETTNWIQERGVKVVEMPDNEVQKMQVALKPVFKWFSQESKECEQLINILRQEGFMK